jgi:hypothetical protein
VPGNSQLNIGVEQFANDGVIEVDGFSPSFNAAVLNLLGDTNFTGSGQVK